MILGASTTVACMKPQGWCVKWPKVRECGGSFHSEVVCNVAKGKRMWQIISFRGGV